MTDKGCRVEIRRAAMNALARREHAQAELRQKLSRRFDDKALCQQVLDQLAEENLQSDQRFAEGYVRFRADRGYGPERIRMELQQKGVDEYLVDCTLSASSIDWLDILSHQYQKKYQSRPPADMQERAKYTRFFLYRGFSHQQVQELF